MASPVGFRDTANFSMRSTDRFEVFFSDDKKFNMVGGVFSATNVEYPLFKVESLEIDYGPGFKLKVPKLVNKSDTLTLTFIDDDLLKIRGYLTSWVFGSDFGINLWKRKSLKVKDLEDYAKWITVRELYQDKTPIGGSQLKETRFLCFPDDTLMNSLSNQSQVSTNQLSFYVFGD